jgi:hypothetical protein
VGREGHRDESAGAGVEQRLAQRRILRREVEERNLTIRSSSVAPIPAKSA